MVERFRREVKAAAKLAHPNIVHAYDAEQAGDTHFLVMEHVDGTSLDRLVAEQGRLPVAQACDCIRQAALGLQHAHEKGMVHRDIKPQNLMRTPDGQVKILDFGLARFAMETAPAGALLTADPPASGAGQSLTQVGTVVGTPDYIAPEQIRDAHVADIRADIYSLGCTLYDLLAGQVPFPEGTVLQKVMAHLDQAPRPLTELRADVPAELARVVARMMAKDPTQRYATPADVVAALAPFAGVSSHRPPDRRRRQLLATAAAALLLAAGLLFAAGAGLALLLSKGAAHVELPAVAAAHADGDNDPKPQPRAAPQALPPRAVLEVLDQSALPKVKVKATAVAGSGDQPVTWLQLRLDGRPLPDGAAVLDLKTPQAKAEAEWEVTLAPGEHELRVLALGPATAATSAAVAVRVPLPLEAKQGPTLHLLAVGISEFHDKDLRLPFSANDARDVADAFARHCAGPGNVFGTVQTTLLLDHKATRAGVRDALRALRRTPKPSDLAVVYYAGHGVKQGNDFYLLTQEADTGKLAETALSGKELRKDLAEVPCHVLLILDACHAAAGVKALARANDAPARQLTDDECAVAVLAAAMGEEYTREGAKHSLFTQALLDGLTRRDVPYNHRDHRQYIHDLHKFVLEEVQAASKDEQHPVLSLPETTRPFALRRVPEGP
jgi:hypothetical protein